MNVLYVFSSNAHPFEPEQAYSKFTAYTLLNFGTSEMDFHKAAVDLAAKGYINRHPGQTASGYRGYQEYRVYRGYQAKGVVSHG